MPDGWDSRKSTSTSQSLLSLFSAASLCQTYAASTTSASVKPSPRPLCGSGLTYARPSRSQGLVRSGLTIAGVRLHDEEMYADNVIVAAGPWSKAVVEWVGGEVHVRPVRGVNLKPSACRT